jgi:hypothetical protein
MARKVLIAIAWIDLIFVLTRMASTIAWVLPHTPMPATPNQPFTPATFRMIQTLTVLLTWIVTSALPIAILIIMSRPRVREAFKGTGV